MKKRVSVGEEFELHAEAIKADAARKESGTRGKIAGAILAFGAGAAAVSFVVGIEDGTYNELQAFWNAYGPIVGALVGYYFGRKNADG